jgi:predicted nucleic acid-binding protein
VLVDTSVLVRYLTGDPPAMADAAASLIDSDAAIDITDVVLTETAYVLTSVYEAPREDVVDHLIALLRRTNVHLHEGDTDLACEALLLCRPSGRVSFADAMLWARARSSALPVYTFDERFPADGIDVGHPA